MKKELLGDIPLRRKGADFKNIFKSFEKKAFADLVEWKKNDQVNQTLLDWITQQKEPCFLLPDILEFIRLVDEKKWLHPYSFTSFELWLNQYSGLSFEENYKIRGKIVGKWIDRTDYQVLFPIGMGKIYEGTHFVTAHKSPDLDTTVASFWGWMDAFAAKVSDGLHIWNLPGGPPLSQIEIEWLFRDCFGEAVFSHLSKTRTALHLTAADLMTQKGFVQKKPHDSISAIDHERDQNAIVVTDQHGFYLGDWRGVDVEGVRQVILLITSSLRWIENQLHQELFSLFAKPELRLKDVSRFLHPLFSLTLQQCEPTREFSKKQQEQVDAFLIQILQAKKGIRSSFQELGAALARLTRLHFPSVEELTQAMKELFDSKGRLIEDRTRIFEFLEKAVKGLHDSTVAVRTSMETLQVALRTKYEVFGNHPHFVNIRAEIEEIHSKIGSHLTLTVVYPEQGKNYPVGIISSAHLKKTILGTVSLRDFCNREEMTIPSYLEVISVIDHHKSSLNTFSPPLAIISDAQSSNSLVARAAFEINDRVKRRKGGAHFIDPHREFLEYLHFLYAILDDTDLLTKVSLIDLECMASLLNRLKNLKTGEKTPSITLDDLPRDKSYLKKGAQRLLQNEDLYSLYRKVYAYREQEVGQNILVCAGGKPSHLFDDTKEQNGCCRVGQTKVFAKNISALKKHELAIRTIWQEKAKKTFLQNKEIRLHLHMISTIVSAEEVYRGVEEKHPHLDEMWIWAPFEESGIEILKRFLLLFQSSPGLKENPLEMEFSGEHAKELAQLFQESFLEIPQKFSKGKLDLTILRFKAGSMNSRKAMVTPFLPSGL